MLATFPRQFRARKRASLSSIVDSFPSMRRNACTMLLIAWLVARDQCCWHVLDTGETRRRASVGVRLHLGLLQRVSAVLALEPNHGCHVKRRRRRRSARNSPPPSTKRRIFGLDSQVGSIGCGKASNGEETSPTPEEGTKCFSSTVPRIWMDKLPVGTTAADELPSKPMIQKMEPSLKGWWLCWAPSCYPAVLVELLEAWSIRTGEIKE